ncbi:9223_t:CDS:1, partial [Dentiscutata erythropus]
EQENLVHKTAKKFGIQRKQVREWTSKKQELLNSEAKLIESINSIQNKGYAVLQNMITQKAKVLAKKNED